MNNDEVKSMVEAAQAYLDGKKLQFKGEPGNWIDFNTADGFHPLLTYRVKPEPMVVFVNVYEDGIFGDAHHTKQGALNKAGASVVRVAVKFVEAQ